MTTEEAIKRLNKIKAIYKGMDNKSDVKALDMAIKALEYMYEDWSEYEEYCKRKESEEEE